MVTKVTNPFCESKSACMGAFIPTHSLVFLFQEFHEETTLNLRFTPYFNYVVLEISRANQFIKCL